MCASSKKALATWVVEDGVAGGEAEGPDLGVHVARWGILKVCENSPPTISPSRAEEAGVRVGRVGGRVEAVTALAGELALGHEREGLDVDEEVAAGGSGRR